MYGERKVERNKKKNTEKLNTHMKWSSVGDVKKEAAERNRKVRRLQMNWLAKWKGRMKQHNEWNALRLLKPFASFLFASRMLNKKKRWFEFHFNAERFKVHIDKNELQNCSSYFWLLLLLLFLFEFRVTCQRMFYFKRFTVMFIKLLIREQEMNWMPFNLNTLHCHKSVLYLLCHWINQSNWFLFHDHVDPSHTYSNYLPFSHFLYLSLHRAVCVCVCLQTVWSMKRET